MVHRRPVYIHLLNVPSFSSRYFNKIKRTSRLGRLLALSLEILVQWDPQNVKRSSPQKKFGMGYEKMHGFHGNLLYDSRGWGVGLQFQSYLGFYLS